jgi:hypothetical protein
MPADPWSPNETQERGFRLARNVFHDPFVRRLPQGPDGFYYGKSHDGWLCSRDGRNWYRLMVQAHLGHRLSSMSMRPCPTRTHDEASKQHACTDHAR